MLDFLKRMVGLEPKPRWAASPFAQMFNQWAAEISRSPRRAIPTNTEHLGGDFGKPLSLRGAREVKFGHRGWDHWEPQPRWREDHDGFLRHGAVAPPTRK